MSVQTKFPVVKGDVAIIGMSCIFPDAPDLDTFWQNIVSKCDAVTDVPADRWDTEIFFDPDTASNDRVYCKRGGFLGALAQFNPLDYGIMPVAVDGGDPGQFLALKVTYQALADAGYLNRPVNRERMEVILGRGSYLDRGSCNATQHSIFMEQTLQILKDLHPEYTQEELSAIKKNLKACLPNFSSENVSSLIPNITTGRIANRLDLMGPNFTVDAACASSLIATELGMQDLLTLKCDMALVGGIFIQPEVPFSTIFCQLQALSRNGQIRPFDKNADGTIIGEGVGVLVLKRLEDAERDADRIYAVIKGAGTSSDGRALSVTAPRVEGAELALRRAYETSGIPPETIELIECHGTGTPAGDAAEIEALTRVFGTCGQSSPWCALGAVKSMIGHAMPASGAAGLIKTALALYHRVLPPTLHCDEPHPMLEGTPLYINSETRPWIHGSQHTPRRAGVSAFGFGGVNAHIVMEEYPKVSESKNRSHLLHWETEVCILQAASRHSLIQRAQQLEHYLEGAEKVTLKDLAHTLNTTEEEAPYRLAIVASTPKELQHKLHYALPLLSDLQRTQIKDKEGIYFFEEPLSTNGKLAFLFPGEGAQYLNMLSDLCVHFPEVRACFDEIDTAFIDHRRGYLPSQAIFPLPTFSKADSSMVDERIWQMDGAIEAVFTANKALFTLLQRLELQPDIIVGHSTGEFSSMFAAGMTTIDHSGMRSLNSLYEQLVAEGDIPEARMVAVGANYSLVSTIISKIDGDIFVAMDNCPHQVVVVGKQGPIEQAIDQFQKKGLIHESLPFSRAYHTPLFEVVCERFRQFYLEQPVSPPEVEVWSCTTMGPYPRDAAEIQKLAASHWMHQVNFRKTIEEMYAAGVRIFVEVGPRGNLTAFVDDILRKKPHLAVASNVTRRSGITQINHLAGILAAQGISMKLNYLYARRSPQRLSLEVAPTTDVKKTDNSMTLSLGFPSMHVSRQVPPTEKTESVKQHTEVAYKPRESTPSLQVPLFQQISKDIPPVKSRHEGDRVPKSDSTVSEARMPNFSSQAMEQHFHTMERFLEVQQEVMQAYLTGKRVSQQAHEWIAAEKPVVAHSPPIESSKPQGIVYMNSQSLTTMVLNLVSERTGYPQEMLDLNLDMEADLGIDSIKRIEILGALQEQHTLLQKELDMEQVASLKTLQQVIDFFAKQLGEGETLARVPTPSITGERKRDTSATTVLQEHSQSESSVIEQEAGPFPFIGTITSHVPDQELVVHRHIDMTKDLFLDDHVLGRDISVTDNTLRPLCVVPMTISIEIMAEVASKLLPGRSLIGMRDIRALRWIPIEEKPMTIKITAIRRTSVAQEEVQVEIRRIGGTTKSASMKDYLAVEGTMVFADAYPKPPSVKAFSLKSEHPPKYTAEELYKENLMFHGTRFQGVIRLDRAGEDGILGELEVLPRKGLFRSNPDPSLITDPFLIDAAGQLVGYWPLEYLEVGFIAFPIRLKEVHLYGPNPRPSERFRCHVRIRRVTSTHIRADIDIIGRDDRVLMSLTGWEDWRFYCPSELVNFWRHPKNHILSIPWDLAISKFPVPGSFECYRLDKIESNQLVLQDIWVHQILTRGERETWLHLKGPEARRTDWLFGRWVAKDAVRMFLKKHHGITLSPADIEIATDEHGRPVPQGTWTRDIDPTPALSLTHSNGVAVAVVGDCSPDHRLGIDIERIRQHKPGFTKHAFVPEEQSLLISLDETTRQEWVTRFWCAKEAVAKALGRGLMGSPQNLAVKELNTQTGVVSLSLRGKMAEAFTEFTHARILAYTSREGDYIIASSLCERNLHESSK